MRFAAIFDMSLALALLVLPVERWAQLHITYGERQKGSKTIQDFTSRLRRAVQLPSESGLPLGVGTDVRAAHFKVSPTLRVAAARPQSAWACPRSRSALILQISRFYSSIIAGSALGSRPQKNSVNKVITLPYLPG